MSEWPTDPKDIVKEALREYVGDGDGEDERVLSECEMMIKAEAYEEGRNDAVEPFHAGTYMTLRAVIPQPDNPYREVPDGDV